MKSTELKKMIKEAVKEAIQEELKDILLEAVRSPKPTITAGAPVAPVVESKPNLQEQRAARDAIMSQMRGTGGNLNMTSTDINTFNPQATMPGGDLPGGNVGLDQIMGLMNNK